MNLSSEKEVSDMLKKIFTPFLLGSGIVGNLLSMIIFSNDSLKKYTTFRLLFLLSFIDICVLLSGCGDILLQVYFNLNLRLINEYMCKIHSFMVIFFTHSSSMILLFMSVDRAIAISVVLRRNQITASNKNNANKTYSKVNKIVACIFALISLLNIHFLLFTHLIDAVPNYEHLDSGNMTKLMVDNKSLSRAPDELEFLNDDDSYSSDYNRHAVSNFSNPPTIAYCYGYHDSFYYEYLTIYFPWVDIFFYVMFPSFVMLICSIIIITKIIYTNGRMSNYSSKAFRKRTLRNKQISYLLLTTNFLFFFMVSPLLILNASSSIQENTIKTTIVYLLAYSNHAFNFISYGISCERYRIELFKLVKKLLCLEKSSDRSQNELNLNRRMTTTGVAL